MPDQSRLPILKELLVRRLRVFVHCDSRHYHRNFWQELLEGNGLVERNTTKEFGLDEDRIPESRRMRAHVYARAADASSLHRAAPVSLT